MINQRLTNCISVYNLRTSIVSFSRFWEAVQIYKTIDDESKRKERAREIFNEFVSTDAETEINIDDKSHQAVVQSYQNGTETAFEAAEEHIYTLMKRDSHPKFIRSDYFKNFLKNQIHGQKFVTPLNVMRSWSNDFDTLMKSDYGLHLLGEFLAVEHAEENVRFLEQVRFYKTIESEQKRKQRAREIFKQFVSTDAENEINIDDKSRQSVKDNYESGDVAAFDLAADHVTTLIKRDKYQKFVRSDFFKKFLESLKESLKPTVSSHVVHSWTTNFENLMKHDYGKLKIFLRLLILTVVNVFKDDFYSPIFSKRNTPTKRLDFGNRFKVIKKSTTVEKEKRKPKKFITNLSPPKRRRKFRSIHRRSKIKLNKLWKTPMKIYSTKPKNKSTF